MFAADDAVDHFCGGQPADAVGLRRPGTGTRWAFPADTDRADGRPPAVESWEKARLLSVSSVFASALTEVTC
jgi:hypothetical protein